MCSWHSLQRLATASDLKLNPSNTEELCARVTVHKHPLNLLCILEQPLRVLCYSNPPYLQVLSLVPCLVLTAVQPVSVFVGGPPLGKYPALT
jgi:hypothetical protein